MSEDKNYEEKDEKELYKHDEKVEENDALSSVVWAFILIWAGLVFLASNLGWFTQLGWEVNTNWMFRSLKDLRHFGVWNLIALGAGAILILETVVRMLVPDFRRHIGGSLITGVVFIGLGLGGWFSWSYLWPLILIAVGVNVLISGFTRKSKNK